MFLLPVRGLPALGCTFRAGDGPSVQICAAAVIELCGEARRIAVRVIAASAAAT
jgi:hypothetical protein